VSDSYLVWDSENAPPKGAPNLLLWRGFPTTNLPFAVSIPKLIEDNSDVLKARYLAWIYDLGEKLVDANSLVDHLELRPEFSYWWMTRLAEKYNYAYSPHITDAVRLMALDFWMTNRSISSLVLASHNCDLAECMRLWCSKLGVSFEWQHIDELSVNTSIVRRIYKVLPMFIQGLLRLVYYYIDRWELRGLGLREWRETQGGVTFFSYLFNLVPSATINAKYQSRYWSNLPDELVKDGVKTNWLHIYYKDELLPTARSAAHLIKEFNRTTNGHQLHITLDSFLTLPVFFRTFRDWIRLISISRRLEPAISNVTSDGLVLWPLFATEWSRTTVGTNAIENCLYLNLFEAAMNMLPKQQTGVYLYEQQPWELALIYAWKESGHGCLIGAQHSTVLYWDLRYFHDPRTYKTMGRNDLPMPNKVAVNGTVALNTIIQSGYPEKNLIEVEALRYLYLAEDKGNKHSALIGKKKNMRLLVLGDYMPSNTRRQLNLLTQALTMLSVNLEITVKPHPACPIKTQDYPDINMTVSYEPIAKLLAESDLAYTSAATSAAVDAYCAGVPVISLLDPNTLNLSPLRGFKDVVFASEAKELAVALNSATKAVDESFYKKAFFLIDLQLPRWRKLLQGSVELK
jgi:surface carbohydrate biosynthesis protein (TIGR04326 family)